MINFGRKKNSLYLCNLIISHTSFSMKILWLSSWFGDYRVPVYDNLNRLSDGAFWIVCSEMETSELVRRKLREKLGDHAIIMPQQKIIRLGNADSDFANSSLALHWQQGLYSAIRNVKPDVIIVEGFGRWAPAGIIYSILHRKRLLMFYERTAWTERKAGWWRTLYRRLAGKAVDCFLSNGALSEQYLRENLGFSSAPIIRGCMSADSFYLHHDVEAELEARHKADREAECRSGKGIRFLYVGRIVERKGIRQLLEAWEIHHRSYPNDTLTLAGEGILLNEMRERYGDDKGIIMAGYVSYDRIYSYYKECDVVVQPTLEDNWSLVIPEAMSCGRAVMCSIYNGGYPELVKDSVNGYSFDPLDKEDFVNAFAKFHSANLLKMGRQGMMIEKNFSPEKAALRIYKACCPVV